MVAAQLAHGASVVVPRGEAAGRRHIAPSSAVRLAQVPVAITRGQTGCVRDAVASRKPSRQAVVQRASADVVPEIEVTIDNCTVLVIGENSVGLEVMRRFAKAGSWVTAFHEGELHRKEIEGLGAMLAVGEATSAEKIVKALKGNEFDAVIYAVGNDATDAVASKDGQLNVIMAARGANIPRFLLVSSAGAEDDESLESVEANLREGGSLKWTVIRTGPISDSAPGSLSVTEDAGAKPEAVTAADVAYLVSQVLFDSDFENKVLKAIKD